MNLYNEISFQTCKLITKKYSTSFSVATGFLSNEIKNAIYSIYGLVRLGDEIVDSFHNNNQKELLEKFKNDCYQAIDNEVSMNPVLNAFAITFKKYNIPVSFVDNFFNSMEKDLVKTEYKNEVELDEYIYGSADVVGLMCLKVFVEGNAKLYDELEKPAMKLSSAFQKVNFLRDLKEDVLNLGRSYFSGFDINNYDETTKNKLIKNIENDFDASKKGLRKLPEKSKLAVLIAYLYFKCLLKKIKRTPADKLMSKRIRISNFRKALLIPVAYFIYKFNVI